jgi:SAM-dependent methyltransferase
MCSLLLDKKPRSVLDVGIGHGKWGFLVREYVDLWRSGNKYGEVDQQFFDYSDRYNSERFYGKDRTRLVGIEIFEPYVTDIQLMIYDEILIGNAFEILPTMEECFELIIAADVVEHLEKGKAVELLKEFKKHGKVSYVLIPINCGRQGVGEHGNDYEIHKSQWDFEELCIFGKTFIVGDIYYLLEIAGDLQMNFDWEGRYV